ncbi:MAG: hemerythrin domain-containing protein [Pseudomonadota bacterium]
MRAIDLLRQQHREIIRILEGLRAADVDEAADLLPRLAGTLRAHVAVEEDVFYLEIEEDEDLEEAVADSFRQHEEIRDALAELESCSPADPDFSHLVDELEEVFGHHAEEDERELLAKIQESWPEDALEELGERMEQRGEELGVSEGVDRST